jgi:Peptidase family M1 domain
MDVRRVRATGAALTTVALAGLLAAPALASPGVTVSTLSSLKAGRTAGTLDGKVINRTGRAETANVTVRLMRYGTKAPVVGRTTVRVGANGSASYRVAVKLPGGLARGNYYLAACTPYGNDGAQGCASTADEIQIKGGTPIRGSKVQLPPVRSGAKASAAEDCTPGARTLVSPGDRVYPEAGNGGYKSVHSDVYLQYDAIADQLLPGTHVDLQQRSTQCLSEFSLDLDTNSGFTVVVNNQPVDVGTHLTVGTVTINGQPATFTFKQPTYPGDPKGQDDPDPLAHRTGIEIPVGPNNPNPPACAPFRAQPRANRTPPDPEANDLPCPATKLVITPAAPIPNGTDFTVTVNYTGRAGQRAQGDGRAEGWFRPTNYQGAMVTSEPMGSMTWMPLNDHTRVKPTYDIYDTVTKGKVAIGNGRLVSTGDNPPDANFPNGSTSWHWRSPEPVAAYLVENSMGSFEWSERVGANGVLYYEAQDAAITPARKALNKLAMDNQEDITHFQEGINGTFPFSSNGILVALPAASFEEEMQTKIVFVGGTIGGNAGTNLSTFAHENMHQWWGDNVSYSDHRFTFFKEGQATTAEYYYTARNAATAAGGVGTPAGNAAYEASIVNSFNTQYRTTSATYWTVAPSNPTSANLFGNSNTYTRPGISYVALRAVLGKDNYNAALQHIQSAYGGGSISEAQLKSEFHKYMPNQSADCSAQLDEFFREWWDTAYPPGGGINKPALTGPGLNGTNFYNSQGGCTTGVGATVPAQLSLSLGTAASFGAFTPGVGKTYSAATTANVISTAGDALLSVSDSSANVPGHLVNGAFSLPSAVKASAASPAGTSAPEGSVSGSPLSLLSWSNPISNDAVAVAFKQDIGANDALRTGSYSKTLTFTLSTTAP